MYHFFPSDALLNRFEKGFLYDCVVGRKKSFGWKCFDDETVRSRSEREKCLSVSNLSFGSDIKD